MLVNVKQLKTVKNFAAQLGNQKGGKVFSASYVYRLFKADNTHPMAEEVKGKYVLLEIDGVKFVTEKKHLDANGKKK